MEDGLEGPLSHSQVSDHIKNGVVSPIMANFPEGTATEGKDNKHCVEPPKVNGENNPDYQDIQDNLFQDSYSSESDALVIDESVPKKKRARGKYSKKVKEIVRRTSEKENDSDLSNPSDSKEKINSEKKSQLGLTKDIFSDTLSNKTAVQNSEINTFTPHLTSDNAQTSENISESNEILAHPISETHTHCDVSRLNSDVSNSQELLSHSNPFFHESLFELSQLHQTNYEPSSVSEPQNTKEIAPSCNRTAKRVKPKPKIQEYAQYLGLQPAVQFKCPKCGKSGFESLVTLQDHFLQCNSVQTSEKITENEKFSSFKLKRKVFLCSTCGTYYENWNLYMHMLEYHRRYICLYCLGMFSILEDLCQHIQSRHNLEPGVKNTLEDFYNTYNEPCYVVCCECNRQFNEGDNFFYHNCVPTKQSAKNKPKPIKQVIAPENHITGDFIAPPLEISNSTELVAQTQKSDSEKTHLEKNLEDKPQRSPLIPANLPEESQEGDSCQVNNDKQNCDEIEKSKEGFSDSSENYDSSLKRSAEDNISAAGSIENKPSDNLEKENNIEENCEQDSLDSTKVSEGNLASTENTMDGIEDNLSDSGEMEEPSEEPKEEPVETRKVPKLSLKLPKPGSYPEPDPEDSDDSEKLGMEVDNIESENENEHTLSDAEHTEEQPDQQEEAISEHKEDTPPESKYPSAGIDIPIIEIELDQPLDKMDIRVLLQKCLQATVSTCIYCNHSRKISVNGKQLALHAMAEHRYSAINKSITEEELIPDSFNSRIAECLEQLETIFFNLDSEVSEEAVTFSHVFECFQCHYSTTVHKELYLHNRKFHSKNLLLCIMCKSNFYSYSELICHLCPGVYVLDCDLQFRCCMCVSDVLPSSFRLMVHLRKRHNVCDVCLEMCHSQYKLSNHVWKHKLHHFCYRCGIAYRNKPDITRHLFWKHGTESVLCKKCLQKKWPHVYHFCVPPASFTCEECNLVFTRAVSLKVHKRLHTEEKKHSCTWEDCSELFISKKLMLKHLKRHTEPPEEIKEEVKEEVEDKEAEAVKEDKGKEEAKEAEEPPKPVKPKVDVYDLPELNLSESDTSDSETETDKPKTEDSLSNPDIVENQQVKPEGDSTLSEPQENVPIDQTVSAPQEHQTCDLPQQPVVDEASSTVMQNIWDNFKTYQANKEKLDHMLTGEVETKVDQPYVPDIPIPVVEEGVTWQLALRDHDYCAEKAQATDAIIEVKPSLESTESIDHDYCFQSEKEKVEPVVAVPPPQESPAQEDAKKSSPRKRSSSSSSSSSGSDSSCACGSDCSCSDSSSGSSSSSSDSSNSDSSTEEGRKKQQQRRLKRKEKSKASKKQRAQTETETKVDVATSHQPPVVVETPIRESDLETTESETDEEFYDREPQKFAKKILEEKRAQLLAEMGPNMIPNGSFIESTSRPPTPPAGTVEEEEQPKKKKKTKKRKKRRGEKKALPESRTYSATLIMDSEPIVPPPPPAIPYYQQFHQTLDRQSPTVAPITLSLSRNSPVQAPQTPPMFSPTESHSLARQDSTASDSSVRASKRRRVPNRFYGYSSDEEADKPPHSQKRSKVENNRTIPAPASPMLVPPITIKTVPTPTAVPPRPPMVEPITLRLPRPLHPPSDYKSHRKPMVPPIRLAPPRPPLPASRDDSATESNDSDNDEPVAPPPVMEPPKPPQPQLYCYCRCPYDEVSEMIGCDSSDCQIEWFHFECVGIMVPPKGQWFCPDCRKRKQQRRDMLV